LALTFAIDDAPAADEFEYIRKMGEDREGKQADYDMYRDL